MKSIFMGFSASFGYFLMLILFWGAALALFWGGVKTWKKGGRFSGVLFLGVAVWCLLVPHWRQFPGWALAEMACRNIGGKHVYESVPVVSDGLLVQNTRFDDNDLARTLFMEGFKYVEEIPPRHGYGAWKIRKGNERNLRYRIGRLADPECRHFGVIVAKAPETLERLYLHGMRADECLVVEPFQAPTAKVALRKYEEFRFFPTPITYSVNDVVWSESKDPIASLRGFYYYESNPRRGGNPEYLDCHNLAARIGSNSNRGWVTGTTSRFPKRIVVPKPSVEIETTSPLKFQATAGEEDLSSGQRIEYVKEALGVGQGDAEVWSIAGMEPAVFVVTRNGEEPIAYTIPPFEREAVEFKMADHHWEHLRFGKVLAFRDLGERVVVLRTTNGFWEIGELDTVSNSWKRTYVRVPGVVVVSRFEVSDSTIHVGALLMRSEFVSEHSVVNARLAITISRDSVNPDKAAEGIEPTPERAL